jgi:hypothetical protein
MADLALGARGRRLEFATWNRNRRQVGAEHLPACIMAGHRREGQRWPFAPDDPVLLRPDGGASGTTPDLFTL